MAQQVTATAKGLFLAPNDLGNVPDGALSQADNVVISREGIVSQRRGFNPVSTTNVATLIPFDGVLVGLDGLTLYHSNAAVTSWTAYSGSYATSAIGQMRGVATSGNLYLTTDTGIQRLESAAGTILPAGMPPGLGMNLSLSAVAGTAVAKSTQVAYKAVWCLTSNGRTYVGAPSGRSTIANTSTTTDYDVDAVVAVPPGLPTGAFLRLYRTPGSGGATTDPGEQYQMIWEGSVTIAGGTITTIAGVGPYTVTTSVAHGLNPGDYVNFTGITAGTGGAFQVQTTPTNVTFTITENVGTGSGLTIPYLVVGVKVTDIIPDTLLGAELYTNPNQETEAQRNDEPPISGDVATFRGATFFANTSGRYYMAKATLLSVDTTMTTVWDALDICPGNQVATISFGVAPQSTPERYTLSGGVYAHNVATTGATPSIVIRDTAQSIVRTFNMIRQPVNTGSTDYVTAHYLSGPVDAPGEILFMSTSEFTFTVEAAYRTVQEWLPSTVLATRDTFGNALFWSKQDQPDAVPSLNYQRVGSEEYPIKRIVATRDALFIFKDDGIWRLTGSGGVWDIQPLDPTVQCPAPNTLVPFENAVYGLFEAGVARVTESGVEIISGPIQSALEFFLTPVVRPTISSYAYGVAYDSDHKYFLWLTAGGDPGAATQAYVFDSWTGAWTRWTSPASPGFYDGCVNPADGRLYFTSGSQVWQERKTSLDADFQDATGTAISSVVQYAPRFGGNPGQLHQFREASFIFRRVQFSAASVGFSTNLSAAEETIALAGSSYDVNSSAGAQTTIRALVPREKSRASQLNVKFSHAQAAQPFQLQGVSVVFTPSSTRVSR